MDDFLLEKYSRQILFDGLGLAGQQRLLASSAVVAGCGAIGAAAANLAARAGVGRIRIVDRDFVEPSNLQRQTLFDEADAREALPKAIAAERKLRAINSGISIEGLVADINPGNVAELLNNFDVILDGTDNFETRFLINDFAVKSGKPWIYAAAVGSYGLTMTVQPCKSACLACLLEGTEAVMGTEDTCDTIGVLGPIVTLIASLQVAQAMKLLSGNQEDPNPRLISSDVWSGHFQSVRVERSANCRCCVRHEFSYLEGQLQPHITMCGRDSVQIHEHNRALDLDALQQRLSRSVTGMRYNDFLVRFSVAPYEMTVFSDGRAIVKGTTDPVVARSLYARYIGA